MPEPIAVTATAEERRSSAADTDLLDLLLDSYLRRFVGWHDLLGASQSQVDRPRPLGGLRGLSRVTQFSLGRVIENSLPPGSRRHGLLALEQTRFDLLLQTVAVATDVHRNPVVKDPIEDGGGDDPVPEHIAPVGEALVRGENQRPAFVSAADEL